MPAAIPVYPGAVFGRLTVLGEVEPHVFPSGQTQRQLACRCTCGTESVVMLRRLRDGRVTSCGCRNRERATARRGPKRTHGLSDHPLYFVHAKMVARCHNPDDPAFAYYGGRGISVFDPWREPELGVGNFVAYVVVLLGARPIDEHASANAGRTVLCSLDRIDNAGDYRPGNLRWATAAQQVANRRLRAEWPSVIARRQLAAA